MDGYEAAKEIRKCDHADAERIPIIALTADAYAGDVRKTRECGMNGHLSKPIDPDMLFQVLQEAVAAGDRK
jgi:CheY-like chemotaxis protein